MKSATALVWSLVLLWAPLNGTPGWGSEIPAAAGQRVPRGTALGRVTGPDRLFFGAWVLRLEPGQVVQARDQVTLARRGRTVALATVISSTPREACLYLRSGEVQPGDSAFFQRASSLRTPVPLPVFPEPPQVAAPVAPAYASGSPLQPGGGSYPWDPSSGSLLPSGMESIPAGAVYGTPGGGLVYPYGSPYGYPYTYPQGRPGFGPVHGTGGNGHPHHSHHHAAPAGGCPHGSTGSRSR